MDKQSSKIELWGTSILMIVAVLLLVATLSRPVIGQLLSSSNRPVPSCPSCPKGSLSDP